MTMFSGKGGTIGIKTEETKDEPKVIENVFSEIDKLQGRRGIKTLVYGRPSTSKSTIALSGDGPIWVIDTERSVSLLRKRFPDKEIFVLEAYEAKDSSTERDDVATYEKIVKAVTYLSQDSVKKGTIVIDSLTDFWSICQNYAKIKIWGIKPTERLKFQWDWGIINGLYKDVIARLINLDCDVILTARVTQVYDGPEATNEWKAHCQGDTDYLVDISFELSRVLNKDKKPVFMAEVKKCKHRGDIIGQKYENMDIPKLKEILK